MENRFYPLGVTRTASKGRSFPRAPLIREGGLDYELPLVSRPRRRGLNMTPGDPEVPKDPRVIRKQRGTLRKVVTLVIPQRAKWW